MFFQPILYGQTYFVLICSLYVLHKSCFNIGYMKDGWSTGPCVNNSHSQSSRGKSGTIFPPGCVLVAGWSAGVITVRGRGNDRYLEIPRVLSALITSMIALASSPHPLRYLHTATHASSHSFTSTSCGNIAEKWEEANCRAVLKYYSGAMLEVYCPDLGAIYTSPLPSGLMPSI